MFQTAYGSLTTGLVDEGELAKLVWREYSDGLNAALELVGLDVLSDTMRTLRRGGTACFTGALDGAWSIKEFSPFSVTPTGVRLTTYAGEASDLPENAFATQLDAIADGRITPAIVAVYSGLGRVADAQRDLEMSHVPGKHVVVLG
ncbi:MULTISPECIES: zinc-binding dehydrogenase [Rhodococcus]|uniref:zinc-binding dehydrogenase n=1 Tax=Rhodococcus TaxID=1827 RepID=UPI001BB04D1F|nr:MULTISPECIES: zinc-binding dehydrogenase [Rhodococcus]MDI9935259.1 zinc-binding dehydrogenase [Rhodococcus sp. IEGM 1351]MDJ0414298.1 zinc-binding dehydrogenase [Rhodococcus opacus]WKN57505.1 zinc-binding dehydrogenase [Rhodococcus opacus]